MPRAFNSDKVLIRSLLLFLQEASFAIKMNMNIAN